MAEINLEQVQPVQTRRGISTSLTVWLALVAYWILAKYILGFLPGLNLAQIAGEFEWKNIIVLSLLGLVGVWFADRTGFPQALDAHLSNRQRFLVPILIGITIGFLEIVADLGTHATYLLDQQLGSSTFNIYFPASLLVYTSGIVMVEAFYRIFPIPFLLFIFSNLILRGRGQEKVFWILAILLSLVEPLFLTSGVLFANPAGIQSGDLIKVLPVIILGYALNLGQAISFRRFGLLASFSMRFGEYMIWHILYGNFIFPVIFH